MSLFNLILIVVYIAVIVSKTVYEYMHSDDE